MTNTVSLFYKKGSLISGETKSDPAMDLWVETLAPYEALLEKFMGQATRTCLDTFSQWWQDANHNGFSAKMLLHLMLWSSNKDWKCSDTVALLSRQTPQRLQVSVDHVSGWWDSISKTPLIGLSERAMSARGVQGLAKRSCWRKTNGWGHRFNVLLRDGTEWIFATLWFTKDRSGAYAACHMPSGNDCRDGQLDGLREYLTRLANESLETE